MEFLQIQPDTHVYEGELEQALIDHLQHFLLELGRGFSFVARQKKFTLDVWGDRIFEKCGIRRDEEGDGGKTLEIRGKRRLSARDGGANYQQS